MADRPWKAPAPVGLVCVGNPARPASAASDEGDQLHPVAGGEDVGGMYGATDDPGVHLDRDLDPLGTQALEEPCHRQALIHFPRFSVELDLHSGLPSARSLARQRTCAGAFSPWRRLLKQPASTENRQAGMGAPPIRA